ncbi:MAG TPA: arylsulfotransferase family protein [Candidatus Krumholzibacteria bacterium]
MTRLIPAEFSWARPLRGGLALCWLTWCAAGCGEASDPPARNDSYETKLEIAGRWRALALRDDPDSLSAAQRAAIERLEAIGYVSGSVELGEHPAVSRQAADRRLPGVNLYCSGHAAEAELIDIDGRGLHRWRKPLAEVWPDLARTHPAGKDDFWRRVRIFDNGDLLAIFGGVGILKLDKDSRVLWAVANQAHHDLDLDGEGQIYLLTRKAHLVPRIHSSEPVLEDFVVVMGQNGEERRVISLLEALERSRFARLLEKRSADDYDLLHANSLTLLDDRFSDVHPALRSGNALVSWREIDAFGVLDLETGIIVEAWTGDFRAQHDPTMVDGGRILLFDNLGLGRQSRVVELDPRDGSTHWSFNGSDVEPFFSETCGTAQRLSNGNTLVTESDGGRAIELTSSGEVVWEFYNPHRAGEKGQYIATLFELQRLPVDFGKSWWALTARASGESQAPADVDTR